MQPLAQAATKQSSAAPASNQERYKGKEGSAADPTRQRKRQRVCNPVSVVPVLCNVPARWRSKALIVEFAGVAKRYCTSRFQLVSDLLVNERGSVIGLMHCAVCRARHALGEAEHQTGGAGKRVGRDDGNAAEDSASLAAKVAAPAGLILGLGLLLGGGYLFKDQLRGFIDYFIEVAEQWGPLG